MTLRDGSLRGNQLVELQAQVVGILYGHLAALDAGIASARQDEIWHGGFGCIRRARSRSDGWSFAYLPWPLRARRIVGAGGIDTCPFPIGPGLSPRLRTLGGLGTRDAGPPQVLSPARQASALSDQ